MTRYEQIQRRLAGGANAAHASRDGLGSAPAPMRERVELAWMLPTNWQQVIDDRAMGHPLELILRETGPDAATYPNFWRCDLAPPLPHSLGGTPGEMIQPVINPSGVV